MIFHHILLQIFHNFNQERSISAPFHLLRGKRSGQTVQDVGIYQLHQYFGILPKLTRTKYNEELSTLIENQSLIVKDDGFYELTRNADEQLKKMQKLSLDGWHYRGNEHIYFARLSLIIQTLSHQRAGQMTFVPIQKDEQVQQWAKGFLKANQYKGGQLQPRLLNEIHSSLEQTNVEESGKNILILRLSGYGSSGLTWQQIGFQENMNDIDLQVIYIATLHNWMNIILANSEYFPLLHQMADGLRIKNPLTGSAFHSAELFNNGHSIEEISKIRNLKLSTIEDHIVELAMNEPHFKLEQFVSTVDIKKVFTAVDDYNTRKLKVLHEVVPHLTYFQLRLVLARGEQDAT
ncbi:helix-turn-helix domain-containing protein [Ureibacillus sinduriensis]|uniref:ATP-dependent DNA helicase RecQ n=1 Tax=Ureibacillus sinduriensis BLB-1 = JCM 15800 TaxID=1384057 RepID=A0A0A3HNZ9_9BACL|nr:helix-turn-helix domain-containing protein [Ureibacillus sinduriensis]KGR74114.1 ATP-dependent DNA helicase RecQ [Ureibacillus sinduriensis BLB-1 = JCM 15800]